MTKEETIKVLQSIEDRAVDFPYMTACDWVAIAAAKRHLQEEPVSNDLEEAANDYAHDLVHDDVFGTFIAGARWQEEQCQKTIELAEDHAYLAGQEKVIEKATSYIQQHWIWNTKMIEDFKNYMKGE